MKQPKYKVGQLVFASSLGFPFIEGVGRIVNNETYNKDFDSYEYMTTISDTFFCTEEELYSLSPILKKQWEKYADK